MSEAVHAPCAVVGESEFAEPGLVPVEEAVISLWILDGDPYRRTLARTGPDGTFECVLPGGPGGYDLIRIVVTKQEFQEVQYEFDGDFGVHAVGIVLIRK